MAYLVRAISRAGNLPFILAILVPFFISGCGSPSAGNTSVYGHSGESQTHFQARSESQTSYPDWFWTMPVSGSGLLAGGMSETFVHAEASEESAIADGIGSLAKSVSVSIRGEYGSVSQGDRQVFAGDNMDEVVSPETRKFVEKNYQVIAKHSSPNYTFVLLGLGDGKDQPAESSEASSILPEKPEWVTVLPTKPGYLYASGQSKLYYKETSSWQLAERRARIALALSLESKVLSLTKKYKEDAGSAIDSTVTTVGTDVQLNDAQVVARWKQPEYEACYVLVGMPLSVGESKIR